MVGFWRPFFLGCFFLGCFFSRTPEVSARDLRFALLIANQQGWEGEPFLPWVLSGDLNPMERALKRLGYQVVSLRNQSTTQIRKQLKHLKRRLYQAKISTFLFYYSGHADQRFFHTGAKKVPPFSYQEFLSFFMNLPIKRKFAILDACHGGSVISLMKGKTSFQKKLPSQNKPIFRFINQRLPKKQRFANIEELQRWYTLRLPKGIRRPKKVFNFKKTPFLRREDGAGIHIIGTIGVAWHDPTLKASLLSAHLLEGLKGSADNIKDGKITIEELYNFVQAKLERKGQKLNRFVLFNGNYTFAPNYQSALHLSAKIVGDISVSIEEFTWKYQKKKRRRISIPTIHGKGIVEIKHRGRCWRQQVSFPRGKKARLNYYGKRTQCSHFAAHRKGLILLEAEAVLLSKEPSRNVFAFSIGFSQLGQPPMATSSPTFELGYRSQVFGAKLGYYLGQQPENKPFLLHRLAFQIEFGPSFQLHPKLDLFLGGYGRLGIALSEIFVERLEIGLSVGGGGVIDLSFWLNDDWGIRLGGEAGLDYTPIVGLLGVSFQWKIQFSLLFSL